MTPTDDEQRAMANIGNSNDGYLMRRYLQRVLNSVTPDNAEVGALQRHEGRRTFAHEIRAYLDEEAAEPRPKRDDTGKPDPDEPVPVQRGKPIPVTGGGARRRVEPYPA